MKTTLFGRQCLSLLMAIFLFLSSSLFAGVADFSYKDLQGKTHTLEQYRGKWVVVNYWATWCPPCLEEMPELEIFHINNYPDKAVVLGINMEDISEDKIRQFADEQFLSFPILPGSSDMEQVLGRVPGLPTTFVVSPAGEVVARQVGGLTAQTLDEFIGNYEEQVGAN